jgi:hypothetical protein
MQIRLQPDIKKSYPVHPYYVVIMKKVRGDDFSAEHHLSYGDFLREVSKLTLSFCGDRIGKLSYCIVILRPQHSVEFRIHQYHEMLKQIRGKRGIKRRLMFCTKGIF